MHFDLFSQGMVSQISMDPCSSNDNWFEGMKEERDSKARQEALAKCSTILNDIDKIVSTFRMSRDEHTAVKVGIEFILNALHESDHKINDESRRADHFFLLLAESQKTNHKLLKELADLKGKLVDVASNQSPVDVAL